MIKYARAQTITSWLRSIYLKIFASETEETTNIVIMTASAAVLRFLNIAPEKACFIANWHICFAYEGSVIFAHREETAHLRICLFKLAEFLSSDTSLLHTVHCSSRRLSYLLFENISSALAFRLCLYFQKHFRGCQIRYCM